MKLQLWILASGLSLSLFAGADTHAPPTSAQNAGREHYPTAQEPAVVKDILAQVKKGAVTGEELQTLARADYWSPPVVEAFLKIIEDKTSVLSPVAFLALADKLPANRVTPSVIEAILRALGNHPNWSLRSSILDRIGDSILQWGKAKPEGRWARANNGHGYWFDPHSETLKQTLLAVAKNDPDARIRELAELNLRSLNLQLKMAGEKQKGQRR